MFIPHKEANVTKIDWDDLRNALFKLAHSTLQDNADLLLKYDWFTTPKTVPTLEGIVEPNQQMYDYTILKLSGEEREFSHQLKWKMQFDRRWNSVERMRLELSRAANGSLVVGVGIKHIRRRDIRRLAAASQAVIIREKK